MKYCVLCGTRSNQYVSYQSVTKNTHKYPLNYCFVPWLHSKHITQCFNFFFFFERQSVQCISHENSSKTHRKLRVTAEPHTLQQSTCFLPNFQLWILHQLLCFCLPQVPSNNRIVLQTVLYCWSVAGTRNTHGHMTFVLK